MKARNWITCEAFPEGGSPYLLSYLGGDDALRGLYVSYPPASPPRSTEWPPPRPVLSEETAEQVRRLNRDAGAVGRSADQLERLTDPDATFVIAGQQPGLLFGPPLALYKLLSTIALARRWEKESGRPVIPLFWIASHDSDRDEIDHIFLPGPNGEPNRYRYPFGETPRRAQVGGMRPDRQAWKEWLHEIAGALPPSDMRDAIIDRFLALGEAGPTLTELFAASVHQLLPDSGVVLFDGRLAEIDRAGTSVMARVAAAPAESIAALRKGERLLEERSITPPLRTDENRLPLFQLEGESRVPLFFEDGRIRPESGTGEEPGSYAERAASAGVRLTPSAALRPVVQDAIFPNAATVVGHSELIYHAQLGPLYEALDVRRPPLIPRMSLFLAHFRTMEKLGRAGLAPRELLPGREIPPPAAGRFEDEIAGFLEGIDRSIVDLVESIETKMPGTVPEGDPARARLEKEARRSAERITTLVDKAGGNRSNLIHRARNELFPGGKPQEHVTSPILFLARYGWDFAGRLLEEFPAPEGLPQLVVIDPREGP